MKPNESPQQLFKVINTQRRETRRKSVQSAMPPGIAQRSFFYFYRMVKSNEFRLGNYLLHKTGVRILTVPCTVEHFALMAKDGGKDLFPVVLTPKILEGCGFAENKKYPLLPESREFVLALPVMGSGDVTVKAYVKSNKECFARLMMANVPLSNNVFHVHQLQNLHQALTGEEMAVKI